MATPSPRPTWPDRLSRLGPRSLLLCVLVLFTALFVTLELGSSNQRSATWDEPLHLAAGYAALTARDYRLDASHPPLARMWAALPLTLSSESARATLDYSAIDRASGDGWTTSSGPTDIARTFLYEQGDADQVLGHARLMIVLIALATGYVLCWWAFEWFGLGVAVCTLALFALSPTVAAHGALVTTDAGATFGFIAALYCLWKVCRGPTRWNTAALALAIAVAILTKYSALVLVPIAAVLVVAAVWHGSVRPRTAVALGALVVTTAWGAVWAAYGFRFAPSDSPGWLFHLDVGRPAVEHPVIAGMVGAIDRLHLLPNAFTQGLLFCVTASAQPAYLLGETSTEGWWYYFPVALLVKTPSLVLILLAGAVVSGLRYWRAIATLDGLFLMFPIAAFLAAAMASGVNIGVRHILPVQPLLLLVAGATAFRWWNGPSRALRVTLLAFAALSISSFVSNYPHTLTFFNRFAGGPSNGLRYLADSNLDWGQGLKNLRLWMAERGVNHINLAYFGQADPEYYGIRCTYLPARSAFADRVRSRPVLPGFVAISATTLSGTYLPPEWRAFYEQFRTRTPVASIGHSILVYWVESWPDPVARVSPGDAEAIAVERALADGLLFWLRWPERAVVHYQRVLSAQPEDAVVRTNLGRALALLGRHAEARLEFGRARAIAPAYAPAHEELDRLVTTTARN